MFGNSMVAPYVTARTAEILRECAGGRQVRILRGEVNSEGLIVEITEEDSDGQRSVKHLVLEKH
jgi:hypothetical protein